MFLLFFSNTYFTSVQGQASLNRKLLDIVWKRMVSSCNESNFDDDNRKSTRGDGTATGWEEHESPSDLTV